ncbi:MAG TPA: nickel pincer cofactor biosynthesis protein LarC [Clostridiales bacterium]|nr:nickel pincer cofactor biosynthesis protein LarC [Clostridiales bacterium]
MGRALYLECGSGISGDMFVASMIGLGADKEKLMKVLDSIPVKGFNVEISDVFKSGIKCVDFCVSLDEDNHDHDMEYLHGHSHDHEHHHHHHDHRHPSDIKHIIDHTAMSMGAKEIAVKILDIIAEAEAEAHGIPVEEVHFHEVGAIDSIVDIISAAVVFDDLDIHEVIIPGLTEGTGTVRCQHGILNVPVPAVANIVKDNKLDLRISDVKGELVTPTGAAIAAAIKTGDKLPDNFTIEKTGLGAGKREYEAPGILRSMLIVFDDSKRDTVLKLETDIDDITGEELGYLMEKLYEEGAREVHFMPVYMKKNRPGTEVVVICDADKRAVMESIIFKHTTTIGIRYTEMQRTVLRRFSEVASTEYGNVDIKTVILPDGTVRKYPEYESLKKIADKTGMSIADIRKLL